MNLTLDLTTIMTFIAGLAGPVAVLAVFNRVAVKLSLPTIVDALMESAQFLDRMANKLSVHPEMERAMKSAADHKARNVQSGLEGRMDLSEQTWQTQFSALRSEMDRDRREDREWRRELAGQMKEITRVIRRLDRSTARNEGRHAESFHEPERIEEDESEVPV